MGSLTPEIRERIIKAYNKGYPVKDIADIFDVHRWTVWKWRKRISKKGWPNYRDRSRRPHTVHKKVTLVVEEAILLLRDSFNWGTQRIKINLLSPPPYIRYLMETVLDHAWKVIDLSRQTINNVLRKHKRNGSPYKKSRKNWKFFRANAPNDMWQIDIRGPFLLDGKRVNALVILDDYSRYLVSVQLYKSITTETVTQELHRCIARYDQPEKILSDNGPQFREQFASWCHRNGKDIEVVHAPPFYPQCKGKVERVIRTFNEEFIRMDKVFDNTSLLLQEFMEWYNSERYHLGIDDCPAHLYMT